MLGERLLHREKSYLITELKIIQLSVSWGCGYLKICSLWWGWGLEGLLCREILKAIVANMEQVQNTWPLYLRVSVYF